MVPWCYVKKSLWFVYMLLDFMVTCAHGRVRLGPYRDTGPLYIVSLRSDTLIWINNYYQPDDWVPDALSCK